MPRNLDNRLEHIPTLKADLSDREPINPLRQSKEKPRRHLGYGVLWLLVLLQSAALTAGGWWGWQQLGQNKQQLAESLHNLARINEQLGARIQRIDGKLVSTASTVNSGSESLRQQISGLSAHLDALQSELKKQQENQKENQKTQNARQDTLEQQFGQLASTSKAQVESLAELGKQLNTQVKQTAAQNEALSAQKTAQSEALAALKALQQAQGEMQKKLAQVSEEASAVRSVREQLSSVSTLATNLSSLKKQVEQAQSAIKRLEREQLALKVEQENRTSNQSSAEFDAFRAQTTRSINNLQTQLQKLQRP